MPLWKEWTEEGARFAIWQVGETAGELRKRLTSSSLPYDEELACLKAESRRLEYLVVRVLLRTLCGEESRLNIFRRENLILLTEVFILPFPYTGICGYRLASTTRGGY